MNAREVIEGQIGKWPTTYLLDALKQAGFVIMSKEDVEAIRDKALEALEEAKEDINHWGSYASEYFQEKHDLQGDLERIDRHIETIRSLKSEVRE